MVVKESTQKFQFLKIGSKQQWQRIERKAWPSRTYNDILKFFVVYRFFVKKRREQ